MNVACAPKGLECLVEMRRLDEDVVGVECAEREDADPVLRERGGERREYTHLIEREWSKQFDDTPASLGVDVGWRITLETDDGEFVSGAGERGEGPGR